MLDPLELGGEPLERLLAAELVRHGSCGL